jgi:hypothetical protein
VRILTRLPIGKRVTCKACCLIPNLLPRRLSLLHRQRSAARCSISAAAAIRPGEWTPPASTPHGQRRRDRSQYSRQNYPARAQLVAANAPHELADCVRGQMGPVDPRHLLGGQPNRGAFAHLDFSDGEGLARKIESHVGQPRDGEYLPTPAFVSRIVPKQSLFSSTQGVNGVMNHPGQSGCVHSRQP